jgi:hypothetical protein
LAVGGSTGAPTGRLQVSIDWPGRGRYVPPYANSIRAQLTLPDSQLLALVLNRAGDSAYSDTVEFASNLPLGSYSLTVEAFSQTDAQGEKVATAILQVQVNAGQTTNENVSADLQSTIDHIEIDGQPLSVEVGQQLQLTGHAEDSQGTTLLLPPSALTWSITAGASNGSISPSGLLSTTSHGTISVRLSEDGAEEHVDADVTVNPLLETLVFHRNTAGNPNYYLWKMKIDGSGLTQLTFPGSFLGDRHPSVSPDGQKIAFVRLPIGSMGHGNICVINFDGSGFVQLTSTSVDDEPTWSPDGTKIAFQRGDPAQLMIMNADGSSVVAITSTGNNTQPTWSPSGTQIAFQSNRQPAHGDEIRVINVNGSGDTRLTFAAGQDAYPSWTKDGRIIFQSEGRDAIYIINPDGSGELELIPFGIWAVMYQTAVTPDGTKLVCEVDILPGASDRELLMFNIDGSGGTNLSNDPNSHDFHPAFAGSP